MQIHELNNYNGNLDSSAYLAVDNGSDTGKVSTVELLADTNAAVSNLDTVLNGRIDNIVAGGEAPSASEIVDARYGADGVTYPSLGAAIRNQVTDLKSDLVEISDELNDKITGFNMITGGFINKNGIQTSNQPTFSCSDYIEVNSFNKIYCVMGYGVVVLAFYDFDKKFISYLDTTGNEYTPQWWDIEAPQNAVYLRFSNKHDVLPDDQIIGIKTFDKKKLNERIDSCEEAINGFSRGTNYIQSVDFSNSVSGSGVNYVGQYISDNGISNLTIDIKKGDKITLTCTASTGLSPISRYNGVDARNTPYVIGVGVLAENTYTFTADEDFEAVISYFNAYPVNASVTKSYVFENFEERLNFLEDLDYSAVTTRILCVGDSLTAGDFYPDSPSVSVGDNAKSYPYFLSKKMNIECVNKGSSGATPTTWFDRLYTETVFNDYDCMILWLGTNLGLTDTIETDVDAFGDYHDYTNNTGKYCRIIEEFKEKSNNAPIFLVKLFGCTTEDAMVTSNIVIDKIAEKYGLQVIDTMELRWYDTSNTNYSKLGELVHTKNHLHFSTFGNMYLAHKFHKEMNEWWKHNIDKMDKPYRTRGNGLHWWMEY